MNSDQKLFMRFCRYGDLGLAKAFIQGHKNLDINFEDDRDGLSMTPLWMAAIGGQVEMVKFLLESGAKTYSRTHSKEKIIALLTEPGISNEVKQCIDLLRLDSKPGKKSGWFS